MRQPPRREQQPDGNREHRLEHHRPRDVPDGQGVLATPGPDHAGVEDLGQLRGDRSDQEREGERLDVEPVGQVSDDRHEQAGSGHDHGQPGQGLHHADPRGRLPGRAPPRQPTEVQRLDLPGGLLRDVPFHGAAEVPPHVQAVRDNETPGQRPVERLPVPQAGHDGQGEEHQEDAQVQAGHPRVGADLPASPSTCREQQHGQAEDEHGQGGEHERRAQDGPDADLLPGAVAEHDGDQRQDGLRERGAHRRQHAADRALGEPEALPHPLPAVGEQLRPTQDHPQGHDQQEPVH